jgi:hypothetical protein
MPKSMKIGAAVALLVSGVAVAQPPAQRVVQGELNKYSMVVQGGDRADICAQAGMVKAAMLQAQDSTGYAKWTRAQRILCTRDGTPTDAERVVDAQFITGDPGVEIEKQANDRAMLSTCLVSPGYPGCQPWLAEHANDKALQEMCSLVKQAGCPAKQ